MSYFDYACGLTMTNKKFHQLFKREPRKQESELEQFHMDLASSIQNVTEEIMIKLAKTAKKLTGSDNLVMSGGVALNCVGNGKILQENIFKNIWIQPASGDAGGALGVAQTIFYKHLNSDRAISNENADKMEGSYLGKKFSKDEIKTYLDSVGAKYSLIENEDDLVNQGSDLIISGKVIGWHSGRMEFGPRSLGARSILGDPRNEEMQSVMNLKIKFRESFRPFAPAVIEEKTSELFELNQPSPYMLLVAPVKKELRTTTDEQKFGIEKLKQIRSTIPAVTHVDYSARVQTVSSKTNPRFHKLIKNFGEKTNCYALINTSFNVRGEPIVYTPKDSYTCFMRTGIDVLVIENFLLLKDQQPSFFDKKNWKEEYILD
jgi:carbamoyltransferase